MTNRQKYCLIIDDDGHWYLVPFERKQEAEEILDSIADYWESDIDDNNCPEMPDWLKRIDGLHKLTFENPVEE